MQGNPKQSLFLTSCITCSWRKLFGVGVTIRSNGKVWMNAGDLIRHIPHICGSTPQGLVCLVCVHLRPQLCGVLLVLLDHRLVGQQVQARRPHFDLHL